MGVEDNGEITGLGGIDKSDLEYLEKAPTNGVHRDTPLSSFRVHALEIDGNEVIYYSISKSVDFVHLTADGRCVQRKDLESVPISSEEITLSRQEKKSREYDREFIDGPQAEALDLVLAKTVADQISKGMSIEKCLQHLYFAEYAIDRLKLRRAALLLLSREPAHWHPRLQIRIMKIDGATLETGENYNVVSDQVVSGNIASLVENAWDALRPQLIQTRLTASARFESRVMYPELACREALVNAIAHRDYSQEGRAIEIYVFDDRMEIVSPGPLLSTLTVSDLLRLEGAHQSRNSLIARGLREMGYMREVGEGMRRIFELMKSSELAAPEIVNSPDAFTVILHHKPVYSEEHLLWLEEFSAFDLDREEKSIVILGYGDTLISPNDIWHSLGLVDTEHYRQLVYSLQQKRILISEVPKQKARLMARGKQIPVRDIPRFRIRVANELDKSNWLAKGRSEKPKMARRQFEKIGPLGARLFVASLYGVSKSQIVESFSIYGIVEEVVLPLYMGRTKGFAFVQFEKIKEAQNAITELAAIIHDRRMI